GLYGQPGRPVTEFLGVFRRGHQRIDVLSGCLAYPQSNQGRFNLTQRGIGLKVLTGQGAALDTTTASGKLVFGIFAALAEFERELISERTIAGLAAARARGRKGGRPYKMTPAKLRLAMASMGKPGTNVGDLCKELGITRQTLYRHVSPTGELREDGRKLLAKDRSKVAR
ncbi:recombinase family protein, partial [Brevibacterium sp. R8603A2]|uniref:recombinase family protein n=1 Tax=Brevibacterium sp. R8603A2 TaxID=2929779 RepID=UPI001FF7FBB9